MIKFVDNHVESVEKLKKFKKITGTRLGAILGVNNWKTSFETWLELTKIYEAPFEDTMYTVAGKALEPKQLRFLKNLYFPTLVVPTDVYGEDPFSKTYGNFYDDDVFGGMWDALVYDKTNDHPVAVVEAKSTKRVEDWENDKIPESYALQASLYAFLKGLDQVYMIVTFTNADVYKKAQELIDTKNADNGLDEKIPFEITCDNTKIIPFKVSERYPEFAKWIEDCRTFYETSVKTGISPDYDLKKDKKVLKEIKRLAIPETNDDTKELLKSINSLQIAIDVAKNEIDDKTKDLKKKKEILKKVMLDTESDLYESDNYSFTLGKSVKNVIDEEALKADGLYEKYKTQKETLTLRTSKREVK
ncbi:MAG: YqaJ viral recombinase family protein [Bacilli bacterium]